MLYEMKAPARTASGLRVEGFENQGTTSSTPVQSIRKIKGPDNPTCVFFRKSVAVDTIGSLSKGTSECASVSQ